MRPDGLIFDLDGTLWDCTGASAHAYNLAYEKFGIPRRISQEFVRSISGRPSSECEEILLEGVPIEQREELGRHLDGYELAAIRQCARSALYPGVLEGFRRLVREYALFVVSNCGERYLGVFRRHTAIGELVRDSECFGRTEEPKNDNIRSVIERNGLRSPCYIGDTAGDEDAAARAKVPFFHVRYGFGMPLGSPTAFATFGELTDYFTAGAESTCAP